MRPCCDTNPRRKLTGFQGGPRTGRDHFPEKGTLVAQQRTCKKHNGGEAKKNDFRIPHDV